jgi:hypothetical protein
MARVKQGAHIPRVRISPSIEVASYSRQEIVLTDEQVSMLRRRIAEFRAADPEGRISITQGCVNQLKRSWGETVKFEREMVTTVSTL